jgi:hypothetical protein
MKIRYFDATHFAGLCHDYPSILLPPIEVRNYFREKILGWLVDQLNSFIISGRRFWKRLTDHRHTLYIHHELKVRYVPVRVLLVCEKNPQAIAKYIEKRENVNPMRVATLRSATLSRIFSLSLSGI